MWVSLRVSVTTAWYRWKDGELTECDATVRLARRLLFVSQMLFEGLVSSAEPWVAL